MLAWTARRDLAVVAYSPHWTAAASVTSTTSTRTTTTTASFDVFE
jgi:hypothetical protein